MPLSTQPPRSVRTPGRTTALLLVIGLAVLAAYLNTRAVPFLLDDEASILENESLARLADPASVLWPRSSVYTAGRPLLNLSFALNHAWGGTDPSGYHVVNAAIHLLAAFTLFGLVRQTLLLPRRAERFSTSADSIAFAAALLWALHPLQTVSVTYISQRAESLMGLCYLGTLYAFLRAAIRPGGWTLLTVTACSAGMLVKEVMVTAPVMVLLFDRTFLAGSFAEAWRCRRRLHLSLAVTWLVLAALVLNSGLADRGVGHGATYTWHEYFRVECGAILHYLRLAIAPFPLVFDYGEQVAVPSAATFAATAGLLGLIVAGLVWALRQRPALGFLGCWFLLILAPTSSFIPIAGQPIAENRVYLPLAAVGVGIVAGVVHVLGRRAGPALLALALALGWGTVRRNHDYRSELALWRDTLGHRPMSSRAHCHYGTALLRAGRAHEAIGHLERAVQIQPRYSQAYVNLATACLGLQRNDEAVRYYGIALRLNPNDAVVLNNLGSVHFQAGRKAEALPYYRESLRARPGFVDAQLNLGTTLAHLGRWEEALAVFEDAAQKQPRNPSAQANVQQLRTLLKRPPSASDR